MTATPVGAAIEAALEMAGLSQRALASRTGIPQTTLSRIITGRRTAKMTEIVKIADATGATVAQLTGTSASRRARYTARPVDGAGVEKMRAQLAHFIELNAYLDDLAIPDHVA
ncbi:MAG: helix-turn-helix domain-containing protein [Bifidobacteriaceae bacterium]|nr:helix-turn-helix domain-containing protein [Bifidobacteriaceae bacterium]